MLNQSQVESRQAQASVLEAPAAMRVLDAGEMRAVVGGPIIDNGVSVASVAQAASNSNG